MRLRTHAGAFLYCCLVLMLATGLYQRVANPSLSFHLAHPDPAGEAAAGPAQPTGMPGKPPSLTPESSEKLAKAMADLRQQPDNAEILLYIADIFVRNEDWHNAVKFTERAAKAAPASARAWHAHGLTLFGHKDFKQSADAFERVLVLVPGDADAMANLIILYGAQLKQPEKAAALARAVLASPDAGDHARQIAEAYLKNAL